MTETLDNLSIMELKSLAYDKQRDLLKHRHFALTLEKILNQIVAVIDEKESAEKQESKPVKNKLKKT